MTCSTERAHSTVVEVSNLLDASTAVFGLNPLSDSRWDEFIATHPVASVFHSSPWLRALKLAYGYDPMVFTTSLPSMPLTNALLFCRVTSWLTGRRLISLPFSDHCEPLVSGPLEFDHLLLHLKRYADFGKWKYVEIRPTTCQLTRSGFYPSIKHILHLLDLRASLDELFFNFHKDCVQRKIRRAEREQLRYEEGRSEELLRAFYQLQIMTRRRKHLPPQPLSWFRALAATFGERLKIRISWKEDGPIAAMITIAHKSTMMYKYGCSDARFHKLGGTALLFWKAIQEAKNRGLEQFDMGRSENGNVGLISFKEHWGAVGREISHWTYPARIRLEPTHWQTALLRRVIPFASDVVLKTAGELLYRHIG